MNQTKEQKVIFLLRISIAFTFLYAAISGFISPNLWVGYLPEFATTILPVETLLVIFGVVEILLSLAIIFLKNPFYPAILAALLVSGIIVFNIPQFSVLFRDVPIVLMSIALAIYFKNNEQIHDRGE